MEAVAAGHRARLPVRRGAGRRRGDPDLPLLHPGEAAEQAPRGVRPGRHRGRRRPGGGEQRVRGRHHGAACSRSACRPTRPRPSARRPDLLRHPARAAAAAARERLVWGLLASLFIGNTLLVILNLPLAPLWAKLLRIPRPYLYAGILFFAAMGAYAVNGSPFDLILLLGLGIIGFGMRRFGYPGAAADRRGDHGPADRAAGPPRAPARRGQPARAARRRRRHHGPVRPVPARVTVYVIIVLVLLWPLVVGLVRRRRAPRDRRPAADRRIRPTSGGDPNEHRRRLYPVPRRAGRPARRDRGGAGAAELTRRAELLARRRAGRPRLRPAGRPGVGPHHL